MDAMSRPSGSSLSPLEQFLARQERVGLLRFLTCGSR
jgi:hypothetical protein